ncbi:MAG: hypothetical protein JST92_14205 [Deltaproteobacteria bacterium]|nr:hypothetical protein [Deltaproteobacteria bacterium]
MNSSLDEPTRVAEVPPRQVIGALFRETCAWLSQQGLVDVILADVPPETQALIKRPPFALRWVPGRAVDDISEAIARHSGLTGCRTMGQAVTRELTKLMVMPLIRAAFLMFGESAETMFMNVDRFYATATRGIHFSYLRLSPGAGRLYARFEGGGLGPPSFAVIQGTMQWIFDDLLRTQGTVHEAVVNERTEQQAQVHYDITFGAS